MLSLLYLTFSVIGSFFSFMGEAGHVPGFQHMAYSKFRSVSKGPFIPTQVAMLGLYGAPLLTSLWSMMLFSGVFKNGATLVPRNLVPLVWALHFTKRLLEVLFVHKYSGPMDAMTAIQIGLKYSLDVFVTGYFAKSTTYPSASQFWLGLAIFTFGEIGNAIHHWFLAQLRRDPPAKSDDKASDSDGKVKNYVVPQGGLFSLLVTPHYFFELVAIAGIVIVSGWEPSMIGVFCFMTGYLAGRSAATQQWYLRNVKAWKQVHASRYRLIPYVW